MKRAKISRENGDRVLRKMLNFSLNHQPGPQKLGRGSPGRVATAQGKQGI